ncbi:alpha/beta hydrolase [Kitasatospora sp. NPDC093806]|uniref:alpha/beta hydrolase n=1 Tax=Kitasatospora sp. NPDC093806 TaxID=3155075 RepID=UPI00343C8D90
MTPHHIPSAAPAMGGGRVTARRTAVLALAVAAACAATAPAATATPDSDRSGAPPGLSRYYHQRLDWRSCLQGPDDATGAELERAGARCADVTVPLDYADPRGRSITVAISRIRATDTRHRIGALLLNDGGPGGATLDTPPRVHAALKDVAGRYDVVGVDPRFVGRSTPLNCGWPVGTALLSAGTDRSAFDRQVALHKGLAAKCRAAAADVLPFAGTRNTARDMDVIRGALGERRISYLGVSYGTYLGTVYTQMFPGRYDRVVLDGALDPRVYGPRMLPTLLASNERALADWAAWAAARHDTHRLGRTPEEVVAGLRGIVAAAARGPLTVGTGPEAFRLDDTQVPLLLFAGLADDTDDSRTALAENAALLTEAAAGRPTRPSPSFTATLRTFFTGAGSASASSQQATLCADGEAPRDPETYWRDVERSRTEHPLLGPAFNNISPCAFWDRPREPRTEVRRDAPALIVAATGDPRTPYPGSVALRGLLPSSRLLTLQGANRHALYGMYGNACVDTAVNAYLATGVLPSEDVTCAK